MSISCTLAKVVGRVPPIVEFHGGLGIVGHPFDRQRARRLVAAMAVDDQDAAKALRLQAVEDIADEPHIGLDAQGDRAGIGQK